MHELRDDNSIEYLRSNGWLTAPTATVETLSGGVSNQVLRVRPSVGEPFIVKQARAQLRTKEAWFSDLERIYREHEVMEALFPFLPEGTVPKVLFVDRANFAYGMSHAPEDAAPWKQLLLKGEVDVELGDTAGRLLGQMHCVSAERRDLFERFADSRVFVQLRIEPFYRRVQERCPEVAEPIGELIDSMLTRREALCHGDYTPKNMLVYDVGFTLVDYETAYFGDPAMDVGLFAAHIILKAFHRPEQDGEYFELHDRFLRSYAALAEADWLTRGRQHMAACLLARVAGTSPVDYLADDQKAAVRALALDMLLETPG